MPSTISAGTTAGTAIAIAGDTTGNLAFQTNGTTTAMTIDTSQNVLVGDTTAAVSNNNFIATQSLNTTAGIAVINNNTGSGASASVRYKNSGSTIAYTLLGGTNRASYAGLGANILSMYTDNAAGMSFLVDAAGPITFNTSSAERGRFDASGNFQFNSGYGSVATAYGCRAWVNFVGSSGAINSSGGVSSVTRNGTGDYSVNFSFTFPDANYAGTGMGRRNSSAQRAVLMVMNNTATYNQFTTYARFYTMLNDSATVEDPIFFNYTAVR